MTFDSAEVQRLAQFLLDRQTHLGPDRESTWEFEREAWDDFPAAAKLLKQMHARIAELEAAVQWAGWMPLDQAPQGELMLFCDMRATELRASFFVDWMVGGKFCGNRHHTATHCMKLPPAPTANAIQINDLGEKSANDTPAATPWCPDDSGEWVEVPEDLEAWPPGLDGSELIEVLMRSERDYRGWTSDIDLASRWDWAQPPGHRSRIVAYKVVKP